MKHKTAPVNWYEGMFLQSHHFQTAERNSNNQDYEKIKLVPYWWGISNLEIDNESLKGNRFKIIQATLRLKDGTWISIPNNAEAKEKVFELESTLSVWLCVKKKELHYPVLHGIDDNNPEYSRPLFAKNITVDDENSGENEEVIQIRLWNVIIKLGLPPEEDYEYIKIGEITRSSQSDLPAFNTIFIPPLLKIGASPRFIELLRNVVIPLNNRAASLQKEIAGNRSQNATDIMKSVTNLIRLQVTSSIGLVLKQILETEETHPLHVYLELVRLSGSLMALTPGISLNMIPKYNHNDITACMGTLFNLIEKMLGGVLIADYKFSVFEIKGKRRVCRVNVEWIEKELPVYLCIEAENTHESHVDKLLDGESVKIGPPSIVDDLLKGTKRGIPNKRIHLIPHGMPDRSGLHYYKLDLSKRSPFYKYLREDAKIEIRGIPESKIPNMKLYVLTKKHGDNSNA